MDKSTDEMRIIKWTSIIKQCRSSEMTVTAWCEENNINPKTFYYWQRKIRKRIFNSINDADSTHRTNFIQLPVSTHSSADALSFKPDIVLHVGNNVLELSNTTSENLLSLVLKVIGNVK